ncbi:MAG TPA: IS66 family insertion sequence element accessory protein TnpB [Polyangiaceae bacterium]|jgi:transposase
MVPSSTRIFVCTAPVDMRRSFSGLADSARELVQQDPATGALFLFTGKRGHSLKVLWWDTTGYCILSKRLVRGVFRLPSAPSGASAVQIDARELAVILEGIVLPPRKLQMKAATKEGRAKALRAIATATTHRVHE